jgi:hypothetical protein
MYLSRLSLGPRAGQFYAGAVIVLGARVAARGGWTELHPLPPHALRTFVAPLALPATIEHLTVPATAAAAITATIAADDDTIPWVSARWVSSARP